MGFGEQSKGENLGFEEIREGVRSSHIVSVMAPIERRLHVGCEPIRKRSRPGANSADAPYWSGLKINGILIEDQKMVEPEGHNLECPESFQWRVFYDRPIGLDYLPYGHEFSTEDVITLIAKTAITSPPRQNSDSRGRPSVVDILERSPRESRN